MYAPVEMSNHRVSERQTETNLQHQSRFPCEDGFVCMILRRKFFVCIAKHLLNMETKKVICNFHKKILKLRN